MFIGSSKELEFSEGIDIYSDRPIKWVGMTAMSKRSKKTAKHGTMHQSVC